MGKPRKSTRGTTNYPLTLLGYAESELLLKISYDQQRFDEATIVRMLGHLKTLLESMAINPWQSLAELPLLTADETHQLLVEWNNTEAEYFRMYVSINCLKHR
jgi:non-ribosomal peptide synthetase component F